MSNLWNQRIVWIGISQEGADGEENLRDGESWRPLLLQDVQADGTIGVDVGVVDSRREVELCRLERIVSGEMNVQEEHTSCIRRVVRSHNGSLPVVLVLLVNWTS